MKGGANMFTERAYLSERHKKYLSPMYFRVLGSVRKFPRYKNKRSMDPHVKCFMDETGVAMPEGWGLPTPNGEAAFKSMSKYGKPVLAMKTEDVRKMNRAWQMTLRHFHLYMGNSRILSQEEAENKLDKSTSSGVVFNTDYPTKQDLFDKHEGIREWLEEDWVAMESDPDWTCIFSSALKEEVRPEEKILENSIRSFMVGGVDAVVHGTRLFVDQNEKMYASHLKTASAVGLSPYEGGWNKLYQKLNIFKDGFALDESQYDSSLRNFLMWACAWLRYECYSAEDQTPETRKRVQNYYKNLVNTVVMTPEGILVMKQTGNPSGSVNTITDNTLILYALLAYAWIKTAPEKYQTLESFEMHTSKALVGDDNTWTVSSEAIAWFNARSVIDVWKEIGVTTTTDSLEPRPARELDFLSAHTVFLGNTAVPIYSRNKMMTSLLYSTREDRTPATTLERVGGMLSIGWVDYQFRDFCRQLISWLLLKYDDTMKEDPRWITAKTQIQTDTTYRDHFLGSKVLKPQGILLGARVKLIQPNKRPMSGLKKKNGTKPGKKTTKTSCVCCKPTSRPRVAPIAAKKKKPVYGPARPTRKQKRMAIQPNLRPGVAGMGGYYDASGNYKRGFAPNYGSQLGSILGNGVQSLGEVMGFGDYEVKSNSLSPLLMGNGPPAIVNLGKGEATVVSHREYIGDLITGPLDGSGGSAFTLLEYNINPGTTTLFPWLSEMATLFQFYEMNGMILELKTAASNYAANMALGTMFIATNYNSLDNAPVNKIELLNMEFSTSSKPSESQMHLVECARQYTVQDKLYITSDSNYKGGDPRLYNLGTSFIGSYGCPVAETHIAEIWCSYEVSLYRPIPAVANNESLDAIYTSGSFGGAFPFGGANGDYSLVPGSATVYTVDTTTLANHLYIDFPNRQAAYKITFTGSVNSANSSGITWASSSSSMVNCRLLSTFQNTSGVLNVAMVRTTSALTGSSLVWELLVAVDQVQPAGTEVKADLTAVFAQGTYVTSNCTLQIVELEYSFWASV